MEEIMDFCWKIIDNNSKIIGILMGIPAVLAPIFLYKNYKINKKQADQSINRFSVYINQGFRSINGKTINILLNIEVTNQSKQRITLTPSLKLFYLDQSLIERSVSIMYDKSKLENNNEVSNLEELPTSIGLDALDIKIGWVNFTLPNHLKESRIEKYSVFISDNEGNQKSTDILLLKDIINEENR